MQQIAGFVQIFAWGVLAAEAFWCGGFVWHDSCDFAHLCGRACVRVVGVLFPPLC